MTAIKEHPWIIHQKNLPAMPGYVVKIAHHKTEEQALHLCREWRCNLPKKDEAIYVNFHVGSDFPLVRITRQKVKNQYKKTMYCIEFFKKEEAL